MEIGVLFNTDRMGSSQFIDYAKRIEQAGVDSLWLAELFGREPPEHTARTAASLPDGLEVSPMMMCLRCEDAAEARRLCRKATGYYTGLDYYHRAWRTLGFDDGDVAGGGSDRLIDSLIAWGSVAQIRDRLEAQHEAGAGRVVVIPLNPEGGGQPDWKLLEQLSG